MGTDSSASFFRFLTAEISNQEKIFKRYDCMYPSYVNTNFIFENTGKQKYPNTCSPSTFRNFIIFIPEFSNFSFSIYNENDTIVYSYTRQILQSGLYALCLETLYLENKLVSKYSYTGIRTKFLFKNIIKFFIDKKEFEYKVTHNYL
jgi:hypothetical protein